MDRIETMKVFIRVGELKSFSRAAEQLNLPNATISNAIKELENRIGAQLLIRTTRVVELTPHGSAFLDRCRNLLAEIENTEGMFQSRRDSPRGKIRIDMPVPLARDFFVPLLPEFAQQFPNVEIELSCSDRKVDVLKDGFDCVIRVGNDSADPGLVLQTIGDIHFTNIASPRYIKKFGRPRSLEDLKKHQFIFYTQNFGPAPQGFEYLENGQLKTFEMKGMLTVNSIDAYRAACLAGVGIGQFARSALRNELESGHLVEVLPHLRPEPISLSLIYSRQRVVTNLLNAFNRWLEPKLEEFLLR